MEKGSGTGTARERGRGKTMNWQTLIKTFEKFEVDEFFVAECVYAYIVNYGMEHPQDSKLLNELILFLERIEA